MPTQAVVVVIGGYAVLAVLLLSLNLASLWRWPVKTVAVLATTGAFLGSYMAFGEMLGWPTGERLPARANFLASRIVEPDKLAGDPGAIYVWLQAIDDKNLPVGRPRAYEVSYSRAVATEVVKAQRLRLSGREVVGNFDYEAKPAEPVAPPVPKAPGQQAANLRDRDGRSGGQGELFSLNQDLRANFQEMPPLPLPDKAPFVDDGF